MEPPRRRFRLRAVFAAAVFAAVSVATAVAAPGDLDTSFGAAGLVSTDFFGEIDRIADAVEQPDGKIVAAGMVTTSINVHDVGLARYHPDGTLDTGFGTGGKVVTDLGGDTEGAEAVAMHGTSGNILVAGQSGGHGGRDIVVIRYLSDGQIDTSFGVSGVATIDVGDFDSAGGIAVRADDRIYVAGGTQGTAASDFVLARLHADGRPDVTFGTGGVVVEDVADDLGWGDVVVQPAGEPVVAGTARMAGTGAEFAVARYTDSGFLDPSFAGGTVVTLEFAGIDDHAGTLALTAQAKILVGGLAGSATSVFDFAVARLGSDGTLDATFGTGGKVTTDFSGGIEGAGDIVVLPNDSFVLVGGRTQSNTGDIALARYGQDGSLDATFGAGGRVTTDFGGSNNAAAAGLLHTNGWLYTAGAWNDARGVPDFALSRYDAGKLPGGGTTPARPARPAPPAPPANAPPSFVDCPQAASFGVLPKRSVDTVAVSAHDPDPGQAVSIALESGPVWLSVQATGDAATVVIAGRPRLVDWLFDRRFGSAPVHLSVVDDGTPPMAGQCLIDVRPVLVSGLD